MGENFNRDWGIIADDLTGANDIGSQFVNSRRDVLVVFNLREIEKLRSGKNLLVVDLETRDEKKKKSQEIIWETVGYYKKAKIKNIFLKIDTCFRGNVAGQIEVFMKSFGYEVTFIIPAIPEMERHTINGVQFINGIPVNRRRRGRAAVASPVLNIKSLLSEDTALKIRNITLSDIEDGATEERIRDLLKERTKIIICDSKTDEHIKTIVKAALDSKLRHLLVGSIGLAGRLAEYSGLEREHPVSSTNRKKRRLPLVVIAGSGNPVTREQVAYAGDTGIKVVEIDLAEIKKKPGRIREHCDFRSKEYPEQKVGCHSQYRSIRGLCFGRFFQSNICRPW